MLNGHGDDGYSTQAALVADFSSNVYPGGPDKDLLDFLKSNIEVIGHYPEVCGENLCEKLASYHNLSPKYILPVNGAVEAFYLIAQTFHNAFSYIKIPSFAEYEDAGKANNHQIKLFTDYSELEKLMDNDISFELNTYKLVWLCNPNNPDGSIIPFEIFRLLYTKYPNCIWIIDEAYRDFILDNKSYIDIFIKSEKSSNIIVVSSVTKTLAIPGLRLGYITASETIIEQLLKYKQPWSVNALALSAGCYAIENHLVPFRFTRVLLEESARLQSRLKRISGCIIYKSNTPYFLIDISPRKAADCKQFLIDHYGLLIRDASNFHSLNEGCIRISPQTAQADDLLVDALEAWMRE